MKKPFLHALAAALYIVLIVSGINTATLLFPSVPDNTLLAPITMLSLFVLSAAIMGFLFLSEPFKLYLDNQKQEAVSFFGKTVGFFTCFIVIFVLALSLSSFLSPFLPALVI